MPEKAQDNICCICGEFFFGYGNNPDPVKIEGRCCDSCNMMEVVPARLDRRHQGLPARRLDAV